jgi:DNA polymerase-3 subunit epsilon
MSLLIPSRTVHPDQMADEAAAPDFGVVDAEIACSRLSSICQIGIMGIRNGAEVFAYDTLVDPCDDFSSFNTRIHGITCDHVAGQPTFAHNRIPLFSGAPILRQSERGMNA